MSRASRAPFDVSGRTVSTWDYAPGARFPVHSEHFRPDGSKRNAFSDPGGTGRPIRVDWWSRDGRFHGVADDSDQDGVNETEELFYDDTLVARLWDADQNGIIEKEEILRDGRTVVRFDMRNTDSLTQHAALLDAGGHVRAETDDDGFLDAVSCTRDGHTRHLDLDRCE